MRTQTCFFTSLSLFLHCYNERVGACDCQGFFFFFVISVFRFFFHCDVPLRPDFLKWTNKKGRTDCFWRPVTVFTQSHCLTGIRKVILPWGQAPCTCPLGSARGLGFAHEHSWREGRKDVKHTWAELLCGRWGDRDIQSQGRWKMMIYGGSKTFTLLTAAAGSVRVNLRDDG